MDTSTREYKYELLSNVHLMIQAPTKTGKTYLTRGNFTYYHYKCDNIDDCGWGCGYRTLQSSCSWIINQLSTAETTTTTGSEIKSDVPTILEIQKTLVNISDKPKTFLGSREWIGALEVFYVIDTLYDVPCRILHIPQCEDIKKYSNIVQKYFEDFGGLIMMGGDIDASSKGIAGIHISENQAYFLVIDPHFVGRPKTAQDLIDKGFIRWQHTSQFVDSSFYNLCLPQIKAKNNF